MKKIEITVVDGDTEALADALVLIASQLRVGFLSGLNRRDTAYYTFNVREHEESEGP